MEKDEKATKKKLAEGKKNARKANKQNTKKTLKKAADKALLDMAAELPAGKGNFLLTEVMKLDKVKAEIAKLNLVKRGIRAGLKENKIDLGPLDDVLRLREKDEEDQRAWKASRAIYTEQLGMFISPEEKKLLGEIEQKRESVRKSMTEVEGGECGKEIGSSVGAEETDGEENVEAPAKTAAKGVPVKNEAIAASSFKVVSPSTH